MNLSYSTTVDGSTVTHTRTESDPSAIATLKRKGWVEVATAPSAPVVLVPSEVPLWAFRSVLDIAGLSAQVETILAAVPGDAGVVARNQWEYATVAERGNETISALAAQLGLTDAQVDAYFVQAGELASAQ